MKCLVPSMAMVCVLLLCAPNAPAQQVMRGEAIDHPWVSTDTGVPDTLYGLEFINRQHGFGVGWGRSAGAVIVSTRDGGQTWSSTIPTNGSQLFGIEFSGSMDGFAVGHDIGFSAGLVLSTRDGGQTWQKKVLQETFGLYDVVFVDPTTAFACGYDGAIFKTVDLGQTWTKLDTGTRTLVFRSLSFVSSQVGIALGANAFGGSPKIYRTEDGGTTWSRIKSFGSSLSASAVHLIDEDFGCLAGWTGNREAILLTEDGGVNWETVHRGTTGNVLQAMHFDGMDGWATGIGTHAYRTRDGGLTWENVRMPTGADMLSVHCGERFMIAGGSRGRVHEKGGR